jgi:predicted nucleic acid-binding protein
MDLEVHGSIGILLWNVAMGHIKESAMAFHLLDGLANSSLWMSDRIYQEAQKAITSLLE